MELVENQELQALSCLNQLSSFFRASEHQLEHHVVGEQDVWRVAEDRLALLTLLLTGVAGKGHRLVARAVPEAQELFQLADLTVGQGVHWVDDDRLDPGLARVLAEYTVNDRNDVSQRLTGSGACGQDVALARPGGLDCLALMAVQGEALCAGVGHVLFGAEDSGALGV